MPAMSVSANSTRRVVRNTADIEGSSDKVWPSRYVLLVDRKGLTGHALGVEMAVDNVLSSTSQFLPFGGVVCQSPQGRGQAVGIARFEQQTATSRLDQLGVGA